MSISGVYTYNINVNTIIKRVFQLLTIIPPGGSVSPEDYEIALDELNSMLLAWSTDGLHLWNETQSTLYLVNNQTSYILGGSSSDRLTSSDNTTDIATAAVSGATHLVVDSTSGMTAGDNIGIQLDNGTVQWTTIVSVDSATAITITAALTNNVSVDNNVYWYTGLTSSITNISGMVLRKNDGTDLYLQPISRMDYLGIPNKAINSTPFQYYVDRQRDYLKLYLYGAASSSSSTIANRIIIYHKKAFSDLISPTNLIDFPREWLEPIKYNLAVRLAPYYEQEDKLQVIGTIAAQSLARLKGWDKEEAPLYIGPDRFEY